MFGERQPWHAHVYYDGSERDAAVALRESLARDPHIMFVGALTDRPVGPHPIAQFEIHFLGASRAAVTAALRASGLRGLVHPLTDDDLADHTSLAHWIGEPIALDLERLDPPGMNKGVARFGKSDF